jgi:mannosyltransferase OCH1-like enzyme
MKNNKINEIEKKILERKKKIKDLRGKNVKHNEKIVKHNENVKINLYNNLNKGWILKEKYDSIIPLYFYTCWHTKDLPPLMKENYNLLVEQNPEFTHHLYDEDDCRDFIKNHFDDDVLNAYNSLIPCSYKSDLWRYCVLYKNGGIYMDIKYKCANNFKLIALTESEYFVRDRPTHMTYTALIVVKPENQIMLKCINKIVENVKNKFYGRNALDPTGPGLLGSFFSLEEIQKMNIHFTDTIHKNNICEEYMVFNKILVLKYYKDYRKEQVKFQKKKRYSEFWAEHNIYN